MIYSIDDKSSYSNASYSIREECTGKAPEMKEYLTEVVLLTADSSTSNERQERLALTASLREQSNVCGDYTDASSIGVPLRLFHNRDRPVLRGVCIPIGLSKHEHVSLKS